MMKAVVLAFCVACVAAATHDCPPAGSKYKPPAQTQCAAGSKVCCKSSMGPFFMCRDAGDGCGDGELVGTKDGKVAGAKPPPPRAEDFDDRDAPLRTQKTTKENNAAEKATGKKLRRSKSMSALDKPKPPPQVSAGETGMQGGVCVPEWFSTSQPCEFYLTRRCL